MIIQYIQNFNLRRTVFLGLVVVCEILSSEVPRPRGVSLSRASLYNPERDFTCLDGSTTIPFLQVNDDYCDCPDGSDEPGTSACSNGVFHCTNAGHRPLNIPSSRVNDGICDCCDATDEYAGVAGRCTNNCNELGRTAREEAQRRAELVKVGSQLRLEYGQKGVQLKRDKREKLTELRKHKREAESVLQEKETLKKEAEELERAALEQYRQIEEEERIRKEQAEAANARPEAEEAFAKWDSNQDGLVEIAELQTQVTFDRDRNGQVSDEEARYFLAEKDSVDLETFVTEAWPRVKPFLMLDAGIFKPPGGKGDDDEQEADADAESEKLEEVGEQQYTEEGDLDGEGEGEEEEEEEHDENTEEPAAPVTTSTVKYDDATQKLIDAAEATRREYDEAKRSVREIESEANNIEEYLNKDFGPDEEYSVLEGQCFEYSDREYIYKLCPFDKTVQQPKSNSIETRLGTWGRWETGADGNKYAYMMYERGQSCWNGPQRSTKIEVNCGSENKVTGVSEPNRCEYQFDFITPAACRELDSDTGEEIHDEL